MFLSAGFWAPRCQGRGVQARTQGAADIAHRVQSRVAGSTVNDTIILMSYPPGSHSRAHGRMTRLTFQPYQFVGKGPSGAIFRKLSSQGPLTRAPHSLDDFSAGGDNT